MNHPTTLAPTPITARLLKIPGLRRILSLLVVIGLLSWAVSFLFGPEHIPDFGKIKNTQEKKTAFFEYLAPRIAEANAPILAQRAKLQIIREQVAENGDPGWLDTRWLKATLAQYEFEIPEQIELSHVDDLLIRADIIPPSLIMAQAANESAWGTSRFAKQGNNFFGMRTYEPGTGIVPRKRADGAKWEVVAYDSVSHGIGDYIRTLNTNSAYRQLRLIRRDLRRKEREINGNALAGGLLRYSEKGQEYISLIRSMINSNKLTKYDAK
jgi:Bax protein